MKFASAEACARFSRNRAFRPPPHCLGSADLPYGSLFPSFPSVKAPAWRGTFLSQAAGNWFLARHSITNYGAEGIQWNAGPAAAVANDFTTLISTFATCALNAEGPDFFDGVSGSAADKFLSFVGNTISGGRNGDRGIDDAEHEGSYKLNFCGNILNVLGPYHLSVDYPGAVVAVRGADFSNISGNTLLGGGHKVRIGFRGRRQGAELERA